MSATLDINPHNQVYDTPEIATYTGRRVNPLDLKPEDVDPIDIAHALSNQCRYTGHTKKFYSVGEHCVIIHDYLSSKTDDESVLKWALLHDGDEAYLLDLAAPIKHYINGFGAAFKEASAKITAAIAERFSLPLPEPPIVKQVDVQLRETEFNKLFPRDLARNHFGEALPVSIFNWAPTEAKYQYIWRLAAHGIVERDHFGEYVAT